MAAILRHRAALLGLTAAVGLAATGCIGFTGTKVIEGDAPPGAEFVVEIVCVHEPDTNGTVFFEETLVFTANGQTLTVEQEAPDETPPGSSTCTIVEVEDAGAELVTYECGPYTIEPIVVPPIDPLSVGLATDPAVQEHLGDGGPGMSAPQLGDGPTTATCTEFPDHLEWEIFMASTEFPIVGVAGDSEIHMEFTVINAFPETPTTTTTTTPPTTTAPPAAAPVAAQPTFTG